MLALTRAFFVSTGLQYCNIIIVCIFRCTRMQYRLYDLNSMQQYIVIYFSRGNHSKILQIYYTSIQSSYHKESNKDIHRHLPSNLS